MRRRWNTAEVAVKVGLTGAGFLALGVLNMRNTGVTGPDTPAFWLIVVGSGTLGGLFLVWRHGHAGSSGQVHRWARRSRRNDGVASAWAVFRVASAFAVRRRACTLRPSYAGIPCFLRWWAPTTEFATALCRVGFLRVWSPVEDVTLRIGGPRTGKTGELAGRIIEAPGAVIATSTRTDLISITRSIRGFRGPTYVFNPSGLGGLQSEITFDPLCGCDDARTAVGRAADLLSGASSSGRGQDMEFWSQQARRVLAALLHAAALDGGSMRKVLSWVADPDAGSADIQRALRMSEEPAFELDAMQFLGTNERTRSSICSTIMPALGWLSDSVAAAAATGDQFDVERILRMRATVYMLGADDGVVAPLVTALTGHIARQARKLAGFNEGGRLDPPLTLALDEAALICPIPLDNWTADMGGLGVTIHIAAQSRAQLRQRWGDMGAAAIFNNAATLMLYGGTRDPEDLAAYSALTGERYEDVPTWGKDGDLHSMGAHRVPVLSPAQIAQLPAGRAVIIRRGMPPAIGRVQMAWKRRDVRAVARNERWEDRAVLWRRRGEVALERASSTVARHYPRFEPIARQIRHGHTALRIARAERTEPMNRAVHREPGGPFGAGPDDRG